jgi:hypothetical protein
VTGILTNVGGRSQSLPGLLVPGGRPVVPPTWTDGGELDYPRWEVYHDGIGWLLVVLTSAAVWAEYRLDPISAELDEDGPNTFSLDWSTSGTVPPFEPALVWEPGGDPTPPPVEDGGTVVRRDPGTLHRVAKFIRPTRPARRTVSN